MAKFPVFNCLIIIFITLGTDFDESIDKPCLVITEKSDQFTVDNLGNVYLIRKEELLKFLPSGKFFARYSNLKLGDISSVDATNPLRIQVYYRDFQQIVYLDNQLSVTSDAISLEKLGLEQSELTCVGMNSSLWIYDKQNNELVRLDQNTKKIASTGNLGQILGVKLNPNFMLEHNNFLYLNSPRNGIYVFDIFGAFSRVVDIKGLSEFRVSGIVVYFVRDGKLCSYDQRTFSDGCQALRYNEAAAHQFLNGKIYSRFRDSVMICEP